MVVYTFNSVHIFPLTNKATISAAHNCRLEQDEMRVKEWAAKCEAILLGFIQLIEN